MSPSQHQRIPTSLQWPDGPDWESDRNSSHLHNTFWHRVYLAPPNLHIPGRETEQVKLNELKETKWFLQGHRGPGTDTPRDSPSRTDQHRLRENTDGKCRKPLCLAAHPCGPGPPACREGRGLTWHHLVYAAQEEVGQEGEEGGVEAIDCREVGQQGKRHACRGQGGGRLRGTAGHGGHRGQGQLENWGEQQARPGGVGGTPHLVGPGWTLR